MKIVVNNQLVEYRDEGCGKVVLLLHGWGANLGTFDRLAAHLSKKYRVIRLDFPGFGISPKPNSDWMVGDYAALTHLFIDKLKIKTIHAVIGHSFGGRVIIKAIGSGLLRAERVILIGSAGVKPSIEIKKAIFRSIAKVGRLITSLPVVNRLQPLLRKRLYQATGSTDYLNAGVMRQIFLNVINEDLLDDVSRIKAPTLLIWGEDDTETPLSDAMMMTNKLQDSKLMVIPHTGHFVYLEAADKVEPEIDKFIS